MVATAAPVTVGGNRTRRTGRLVRTRTLKRMADARGVQHHARRRVPTVTSRWEHAADSTPWGASAIPRLCGQPQTAFMYHGSWLKAEIAKTPLFWASAGMMKVTYPSTMPLS